MAAALCTPPRVRKSLQGKRPLTDRKRVLFPSNSPDQLDDNDHLANSLSSSPSVYSPPLPSPRWSRTPPKIHSPAKETQEMIFEKIIKSSTIDHAVDSSPNLMFNGSPRRSPRNLKKSPQKFTNLEILTMLDSPEKEACDGALNLSHDYITPISASQTSPNLKKSPRRSPFIKTTSFYGNSASLLARNEANSVAGIKKVYRVSVDSKAKTKLFADAKPKSERKQRHVYDSNGNKTKKRKQIFTGVGHSLKPIKHEKRKRSVSESDKLEKLDEISLKAQNSAKLKKRVNIRDKINESLDISRALYSKQKIRKGHFHRVLKFTKPERMEVEGDSASKRKYFKTTLKSRGRAYFSVEMESPTVLKKRKLLNPNEDFLNTSQLTNASDILDLIEDGKVIDKEEEQVKEGVDDLILHLDDELQNQPPQENDVQNSQDIFDDSICEDNVLNISNLSIADNFSDKNEREVDENVPVDENDQKTPKRLFPVFEKRSTEFMDITNKNSGKNQSSSGNKRWHSLGDDQYQIDAGQKRFGATQCSTCGILYQLGDPDDEIEHAKYHRESRTLRHSGWQNEKVVGQYGLDRVILVTSDNKIWWNKALSVLKIVDAELGYSTEENSVLSNLKVYMYINNKQIAGCLVATKISHAYKMLISEPGIDVCSEDSFPVKCGISRLWVHSLFRRQGIASRLLDAMRRSFYFGYYLSVDDFAFSAPTEDGKNFAKNYTKKTDYLIYTGW